MDVDSSDDEFEESTLSPISFVAGLQREDLGAQQEDFKLATSLPTVERIQNGDVNTMKDAVISLTQAVSILSTQNNKLNTENLKLKNRLKQTQNIYKNRLKIDSKQAQKQT
jgi:FtsZ-binding cell division protein ZapB